MSETDAEASVRFATAAIAFAWLSAEKISSFTSMPKRLAPGKESTGIAFLVLAFSISLSHAFIFLFIKRYSF